MIPRTASPPAPEWTAGRRYDAGRRRRRSAFSLLEIIIVLAILSVLAVVAMPTVTSMMRESEMREPVERLQELAKAARLSAMLEGYPYEIIFTAEGFEGRRFQLRSEEEAGAEESEEENSEAQEAQAEEENPEESDMAEGTGEDGEEKEPELRLPPLEAYRFAAPMSCRLLFWGRTRWAEPAVELHKERIAVNDRWIFQPSGICNPLRIQFYRGDDWIEIAFNPLTADVQSESSFIAD